MARPQIVDVDRPVHAADAGHISPGDEPDGVASGVERFLRVVRS